VALVAFLEGPTGLLWERAAEFAPLEAVAFVGAPLVAVFVAVAFLGAAFFGATVLLPAEAFVALLAARETADFVPPRPEDELRPAVFLVPEDLLVVDFFLPVAPRPLEVAIKIG